MRNALVNIRVNINGQIVAGEAARVSVFDRGFLYGDSLYEVVRSYGGEFFRLDEHLRRLEESALLCHMVLAQPHGKLRSEVLRTYEEFRKSRTGPGQPEQPGQEDAYCRVIVTRGVGKIGFGLSCLLTPSQYVIIVQPAETPTAERRLQGLSLCVSERLRNDRRALDPAMKSGNYLNSLLAYLEAVAKGYDDALLCNSDGHVTEGTTFNIFYARRGIVATPSLDIGILDGITRRLVVDLGRSLGIEVREVRFPKERLYEADEVFITSSLKEVFPVTRVDGREIGSGDRAARPGLLTERLHAEFRKRYLSHE